MKFTITDTETNLQALMDAWSYDITWERFEDITFWIYNSTPSTQLYVGSVSVFKSWVLENIQTETRPYEKWETIIISQETDRLDDIRLQAWSGQSINVYIDVRY